MIYKSQSSRYLKVKFMFAGKWIRKSARTTNRKLAQAVEAKIRSELARGEFGLLERKPAPILRYFLKNDFLPFVQSKVKPKTCASYLYGVGKLLRSRLSGLRMTEITDQQAAQFAARLSDFSPSTVNCILRTLRRALRLAEQWNQLDHASKITLVPGEKARERVLTNAEVSSYLLAAPLLLRDVATILLGTGMRPGEVHSLKWENISLNGQRGLIRVIEGKTRAARRMLPMIPAVLEVFRRRFEEQNRPTESWIFPAHTKVGHIDQGSLKKLHVRALKISAVTPFPVYVLRHTSLTRLAAAGVDAFTLARIAGHTSITVTQKYCHPQADAIKRAFVMGENSRGLLSNGETSQELPLEVLPPENKDRSSVQQEVR
jgi:integrase